MDEREKLQERYDDAAFALMMDECAELGGEAFLAEFRAAAEAGELPEIPADMDRLFRDTIKREFAARERKVRFRQFKRAAARVAIAVFAVIGILSTLIMSVDAWRVSCRNLIVSIGEGFVELSPSKGNEIDFEQDALAGLLPPGYERFLFNVSQSGYITSTYVSGDHHVDFMLLSAKSNSIIDSENATMSTVYLLNEECILLESDYRRLIWINEENNVMMEIRATEFGREAFLELCSSLIAIYENHTFE